MKTSSNEFRSNFNLFIIECCENDNKQINNAKEAYAYIKERFITEYSHRQDFLGLTEWLQGLALNTPYMDCDIIALAELWGTLKQNATEREQAKICGNYWNFLASKIVIFARKEGVYIF